MSHRRSQKALGYLPEVGFINVLEELIEILLLDYGVIVACSPRDENWRRLSQPLHQGIAVEKATAMPLVFLL
jgi:hypothetical protein